MTDVAQIWKERAISYWNEAIRYLKLMANSGLLLAVYFLIIIGGYYYQQWLQWLPEDFPAKWLFIAVFTYLLTKTNVRTFFKKGDLVFFLPLEGRLNPYIRLTLFYSFFLQSIGILLGIIILMPLFFVRLGSERELFVAALFLLLAKGWNVIAKWASLRYGKKGNSFFLRLFVNTAYVFLLFSQAYFFLIIILGLMAVLYLFYFRQIRRFYSLKWEELIQIEQDMVQKFYRFANLFTDVARLEPRIKRRPWLDVFFKGVRYDKKNAFIYLFLRTFFRAGDDFGMYVRLVAVAFVFLIVIPAGVFHILVYFVFLFLTGAQLSTLIQRYEFYPWLKLYPIDEAWRKKKLANFVFILLLIQSAILSLACGKAALFVVYFIVGGIFSYVCAYYFIYKKTKTER